VGLTAEMELNLGDAGLIEFFDKRRPAFKAIAARAYAFAHENVKETGLLLRQDDAAASLVGALVTNEDLREYLAGKKLRPKYWYQRFADLILDRVWRELQDEHKP